jgi:hypothetical protein
VQQKPSFYMELKRAFDQFRMYQINSVLRDFEKYIHILIGKPEGKKALGADRWIILKRVSRVRLWMVSFIYWRCGNGDADSHLSNQTSSINLWHGMQFNYIVPVTACVCVWTYQHVLTYGQCLCALHYTPQCVLHLGCKCQLVFKYTQWI